MTRNSDRDRPEGDVHQQDRQGLRPIVGHRQLRGGELARRGLQRIQRHREEVIAQGNEVRTSFSSEPTSEKEGEREDDEGQALQRRGRGDRRAGRPGQARGGGERQNLPDPSFIL